MCTEHVIICLGGGVETDGTLPSQAFSRVERGVAIATCHVGAVLIMSSSFTLNLPPRLNADSRIISEASAMARAARALGYAGPLFCEQQSHDTIGSAYFVFSDFLSFLSPRRLTIITSDFHSSRAETIFMHMASLFDFSKPIEFISTLADPGQERLDHEKMAAETYARDWGWITNLNDFRQRFFSTHSNYNVLFCGDIISPARATSY